MNSSITTSHLCIPTHLISTTQRELLLQAPNVETWYVNYEDSYCYFGAKAITAEKFELIMWDQAGLALCDIEITDPKFVDEYISLALLTADPEILLNLYRGTYE